MADQSDSAVAPTATAVVVVGASAGGVEALRSFVAELPVDMAAAVVVVLHIPRDAPSALAAILDRAGPLPAVTARHGTRLAPATVYVAPADHHVLLADGHLHLSRGPTENGHRPALDPLFRSAGVDFGPRAVGVVLSGNRDDGTAGLVVMVRHGGSALVQDPEEALYPGMPRSALDHVPGARAFPAAKLGAATVELLAAGPGGAAADPDPLAVVESDIAAAAADAPTTAELTAAESSGLSCPDCDGVLFRLPGRPSPRFRCRIGHARSPASLSAQQDENIDILLWSALRALEEKAALQRWLADEERVIGRSGIAHRRAAERAGAEASTLRRLLTRDLSEG